jgi:proteasome lid subunit RPN8/RPN11
LLFGKKKDESKIQVERRVILTRLTADGIITYAKSCHPNEGILILQGSHKKNTTVINGLVIPPFSTHGPFYSGFSGYELPFDLSYIGTVHSHPSGSIRPSLEDLHNYFGLISIIISHPYDYETMLAYDRNGNRLKIEISSE